LESNSTGEKERISNLEWAWGEELIRAREGVVWKNEKKKLALTPRGIRRRGTYSRDLGRRKNLRGISPNKHEKVGFGGGYRSLDLKRSVVPSKKVLGIMREEKEEECQEKRAIEKETTTKRGGTYRVWRSHKNIFMGYGAIAIPPRKRS